MSPLVFAPIDAFVCGPLQGQAPGEALCLRFAFSLADCSSKMKRWCISCIPARTLLLRASAETIESASRTIEDGGRERLWSGCEPKPVSANQIHSTHTTQSPRSHENASSIVCES